MGATGAEAKEVEALAGEAPGLAAGEEKGDGDAAAAVAPAGDGAGAGDGEAKARREVGARKPRRRRYLSMRHDLLQNSSGQMPCGRWEVRRVESESRLRAPGQGKASKAGEGGGAYEHSTLQSSVGAGPQARGDTLFQCYGGKRASLQGRASTHVLQEGSCAMRRLAKGARLRARGDTPLVVDALLDANDGAALAIVLGGRPR